MDKLSKFFDVYGHRIIILIASFIVLCLLLLIIKFVIKKSRIEPALHKFIYNATKIIFLIIFVVAGLQAFGVETTSIVAIISVCGAAIALALKDSLGNVAGGLILAFSQPFTQGDNVEINGESGIVESVDLILTTLKGFDNTMITIPNGVIVKSVIINHTRKDTRRVDLKFGISFENDLDKAKSILWKVAEEYPLVLNEPKPFVGIADMAEQTAVVELEYRVWCKTDDYWTVNYYLREHVRKCFDKEGISIPNHQIDINIKK